MSNSYTLIELMRQVKSLIDITFESPLWVVAEINNLTEHRNGHCYLELVQKAANSDNIIAQSRAVIWANNLVYIKKYFEGVTKTKLQRGISVLVKVSIDFHEVYSISLNIKDIDPNYTIGDLERRKKEMIQQLTDDGVINMNKNLDLPMVIKNLAIISSKTAAGYEDFMNHLKNNKYGFQFNATLFQSDMQGLRTENSVINAISSIYTQISDFDVVVIIRGGGSKTDLSYFDNYNIASHVAQFPIPVLSGIGHDRDESVTDIVSHKNFKTPTAVADFIIEYNLMFENYLNNIYTEIIRNVKDYLKNSALYISNTSLKIIKSRDFIQKKIQINEEKYYKLKNILANKYNNENLKLSLYHEKIKQKTKNYLEKNKQKLENYEQKTDLINPTNILKRGYTITKLNGKILKNKDFPQKDDELETINFNNTIKSIVV